jgi:hypothetical protein
MYRYKDSYAGTSKFLPKASYLGASSIPFHFHFLLRVTYDIVVIRL